MKCIQLVIKGISEKCTMPIHNSGLTQFTKHYPLNCQFLCSVISRLQLAYNIPPTFGYTRYNPDNYILAPFPLCQAVGPNGDGYQSYHLAIELSPGPLEDLGMFDGALVGYGKVIEIEDGNGETIYEYSNEDGYIQTLTHPVESIAYNNDQGVVHFGYEFGAFWPAGPFTNDSWKRGVLLKKTVTGGGAFNETVYNYSFNVLEKLPAIKILTVQQDGFYFYYQYHYTSSWIRLDSMTENKNGVITSSVYEYQNPIFKQRTAEYFSDSNGDKISTRYKYPYDFPGQEPYNTMVNRYCIAPIIENTREKNDVLKEITKSQYSFYHTNSLIALSSLENKKAGEDFDAKIYYDYNEGGNLHSVWKQKGPKKTYLWAYGNRYPIMEILGTDYSSVEAVLGGALNVNSISNSYPDKAVVDAIVLILKTNFPIAHITSYTYKPLVGMTSMTDPKGMTITYEYDDFGRLRLVKDQNGNTLKENTYHYKN